MRNMTIGLLLLITLLGCGTSKVYPPAAPHTDAITILHVNDMHGAFLPVTIKDRDGNRERKLGGVLALNHYIKTIRNENHPTLLLNAGDFMTGSPICDIEYEGAFGGALVKFFNDIGFDGLTPGNHEFDISVDNAQKLFDLCNFPVFSANLYHADGRLFTKEPYQIYSKGNLAVGVIGTIVDDLPNYLNRPQRDQLVARPSAPIVDSLAKILDPLTDLIVVLSHNGLQADSLLAVTVGPEVDVIIGGHSHHLLQKPAIVNRKIIVQAGSRWRDLGRLDLVVAADTVFSYNYQVIPLWNEGIESEPSLEAEVKKFQQMIDEQYGKVIGELETDWRRSSISESNIGNFVTDCMRQFSQADFALINSGGIRQDLSAGPIKKLDIKNILPFNNSIVKFHVTGRQVLEILRTNAQAAAEGSSGILQVSGLSYEWKLNSDGTVTIFNAKIGDQSIELDKIYLGATVDFVISNADKYLGFIPSQVTDLMIPLTDVVMKAVEQQKTIDSKIERRILRKD
ncbi:MAG: bifunctional metallophosphatase/5'-nucleotidase [candidate division KSB1 bacterium]|nr:bifunctional metallophosphatase/5'-nucleotidase [candidate division KSB1 bacterium]MDZ7356551.1 bifunctional metallophosphatase/5'-nucleotidase [candidate division KSB1 bacterium]MDZ7400452.1 bifunctional metallophosphatase/5'-nucleotidase [candidate division KSB1 bacterium]